MLCVIDSTTPVAKLEDPLLRSQLRTADVVALSKTDLVDEPGRERTRGAVRAVRPTAEVVDAPHGQVPAALLFCEDPDHAPAVRNSSRGARHRTGSRP